MKLYKFTLILPDIDDATVDAIYGQYHDISIGKSHGIMYAAFDREALSLEVALHSAILNLQKWKITPLRIEMDIPEVALAS
ncbi:hypothetical protein TI05_13010 [Achromatium sp. WMS3]|nr:hypothetical protein TI05_13010 [Achromatium sp. WMS3]